MGNHTNATIVCDPQDYVNHGEILKFLSTETFGRLDGNGFISTLLTDGPNPSSVVKSIHPHVGIFLRAKIIVLICPPAKPGPNREGVC